jgi:hypothetical protein
MAVEVIGSRLILASDRAADLLGEMIDCLAARCDRIDSLLKIVAAKRDQAIELLHKKNLAPDVIAPL